MSPTATLLRTVGDQQLAGQTPHLWPCQTIEADVQQLAVLKRFCPVLNARGLPIQFPVLTVWASNAGETHAWAWSFSLG